MSVHVDYRTQWIITRAFQFIVAAVACYASWQIGRWWGLLLLWMIGIYINSESKYNQVIWKGTIDTILGAIRNSKKESK